MDEKVSTRQQLKVTHAIAAAPEAAPSNVALARPSPFSAPKSVFKLTTVVRGVAVLTTVLLLLEVEALLETAAVEALGVLAADVDVVVEVLVLNPGNGL